MGVIFQEKRKRKISKIAFILPLAWGLEGQRFKSHSDQKSMTSTGSWRMLVHIMGIAEASLSKAPTPNTARWAP